MNKIIKKDKKQQGGFTLLELVVAIAIVLIIGAAVSPILLNHLKDAKVASVDENLTNIATAFNSYFTASQGVPADSNGDGDYLDDVYNNGWLSKTPTDANFDFFIKSNDDGNGYKSYFIEIDSKNGTYAAAKDIVTVLDSKIDDGNATQGTFQYTDNSTSQTINGYYLLYKDPNYNSTVSWHP